MTNRTDPQDYFTQGKTYFYVGVVESINDPLQMGRVQVRCIGYHPEKSESGVPSADLPWAYVMLPTTASGVSGMGATHDLKDGSWVVGFFLDGRDAQQPIVIGSLMGAPGLTPAQRAHVGAGGGLVSGGLGGVGGAFQSLLGSVLGGLGAGGKFGAQTGNLLNMSNLLSNERALSTVKQVGDLVRGGAASLSALGPVTSILGQVTAPGFQGLWQPGQGDPAAGAQALREYPDLSNAVLAQGGAIMPTQQGAMPLSSAQLGDAAASQSQATGQNTTAAVQLDYDAIAASAPQNTGGITIHCSATRKSAAYSIAQMRRDHLSRSDMDGKGIGYHLVIDQTGQLVKTRELDQKGSHVRGMNSFSIGGQSAQNLGVCLIGGLPNTGQDRNLMGLPLDSKFHMVQLSVMEKLVAAFVRRFPKILITGHNEHGNKECPTFNVAEYFGTKYPDNVNFKNGLKRLANPVQAGMVNQGATGLAPLGQLTGDSSGGDDLTATQGPGPDRGYQGGMAHPFPSYATNREPDWPASARTNALTGGRGRPTTHPGGGGPGQQYVATLENPTVHAFHKAREADSLDARSVPGEWRVPFYPHGGEYGQAQVVKSTEGGHHLIMDDTGGKQKIELLHSSGSMVQLHADGSAVYYSKKNEYKVVLGNMSIGVEGDVVQTIKGDYRLMVQGDFVADVQGRYLLNVQGESHELTRGNKHVVAENSMLVQSKKNMVLKAAKDLDVSSGGKRNETINGPYHQVIRGNASRTVYGESGDYVGGNRAELTLGGKATHAAHQVMQSKGETVIVAGGNAVLSAKGKATVVAASDAYVSAAGNINVKANARLNMGSGGGSSIRAGAAVDVDGSTVNLNSGGAPDPDSANAAEVEDAPTALTKESNAADSESNLDAEQVTMGGQDAAEAQDAKGEGSGTGSGGSAPGGVSSGGGTSSSDSMYAPIASTGGEVGASSLGNFKGDACSIANDLVGRGWSPYGASAIVGNMINESALRPGAIVTDVNGLPSGGLVQWNGPRFTGLQQYSAARGLNYNSMEAQLGYLDYEARGSHSGQGGAGMINATDMSSAISAAANFERFVGWNNGGFTGGAWENANGNRAGNALGVYNECFGGNVQSVGGQQAGDVSGFTGGANSASQDYQTGTGEGYQAPVKGTYGPYSPLDTENFNWGMKVSPNFTLGFMCPTSRFKRGMNKYGGGQISHQTLITNLSGVAMNVLEPILANLSHPVVFSGYRSWEKNRAVGGAPNSDHMKGQAVDLRPPPGMDYAAFANWIERNIPSISGIGRYGPRSHSSRGFVHVSFVIGGNGGKIRRWSG